MFRRHALPPGEEFLAVLIERQDTWSRALFQALRGTKRIQVPAPIQIERPGHEAPRKRIETDPRVIAAFFRKHISG